MPTTTPLTVTFDRFEVLAKLYKGEPSAKTFANRTQANRCAAKLGDPWAVRTFGGRIFYVSREIQPETR
jgi:hypothetical protein